MNTEISTKGTKKITPDGLTAAWADRPPESLLLEAANGLVKFRGIGKLVHKYFYFFALNTHCTLVVVLSEKSKYNSVWLHEIMQECFPEHSRIRTARLK